MTATAPGPGIDPLSREPGTVREALDAVDATIVAADHQIGEEDFFDVLHAQLRRLHAQFRIHHAAATVEVCEHASDSVAPEYAPDRQRLCEEHNSIFGMVDRLARSSESMVDLPVEDKEVFIMRVRELVAILRRHLAEEDRLCYLSLWSDIGGES